MADDMNTGKFRKPDWTGIRDGVPWVIGHRGHAESYPENTLPSFRAALAAGADMVELDFRETANGVLVCAHDDHVSRCIDLDRSPQAAKRRISTSSSAVIAGWDAGARKNPSFAGIGIPTVEEAVKEILKGGGIPVLERKSGAPRRILDLLRRMKAVQSVCVQSFDWQFLRALHFADSTVTLAALGKRTMPIDVIPAIRNTGARIVNWDFRGLTKSNVRRLHEPGFPVWTWTVNRELEFRSAVEMGLDAITTDAPDRLRRFLDSS